MRDRWGELDEVAIGGSVGPAGVHGRPACDDDQVPTRLEPDAVVVAPMAAPWGPVHVAVTRAGVAAVELMTTEDAFVDGLARRLRRPVRRATPADLATEPLATIVAAIGASPDSRPDPARLNAIPLDLGDRPAWDREVLAAVRAIPRGETRSYGDIARAIGRPGAARAVGGAVGRNPVAFLVPCHRVVAADGTLGGYGGGWWGDHERLLQLKAELLAGEGIELPRSLPGGRSRSRRGR